MRRCASCGTPLSGRRGHGFVTPRGVVCGQARRRATVTHQDGSRRLTTVETPRCAP